MTVGGAATRGGTGVCEKLPVIKISGGTGFCEELLVFIAAVLFILIVIFENTKTNSYFPKKENIKLFMSIQIVLFRQIPRKGQTIHRQVPFKIQASLDRILFIEKFPEKNWRGHSCFHFKPSLFR